jgi:hypothetical protein
MFIQKDNIEVTFIAKFDSIRSVVYRGDVVSSLLKENDMWFKQIDLVIGP